MLLSHSKTVPCGRGFRNSETTFVPSRYINQAVSRGSRRRKRPRFDKSSSLRPASDNNYAFKVGLADRWSHCPVLHGHETAASVPSLLTTYGPSLRQVLSNLLNRALSS